MRHLATIQEIESVTEIPEANSLDTVLMKDLGWHVCIKRGTLKPGDKVVYCETDSVLPKRPEFAFLEPRHYRIKTVKFIKGQYLSQGICFPLSILPKNLIGSDLSIGTDVTDDLCITKYDPPEIDENDTHFRRGRPRGRFPSGIHKTDEIRVQNIPNILKEYEGIDIYWTEKFNGTSMSVFYDNDTGMHVCSRNLDLAPDYVHKWNNDSYWRCAMDMDLGGILRQLGNVCLQGELIGPSIQGNPYKLKELQFRIFNIWDMERHFFYDWRTMCDARDTFGLKDMMVVEVGRDVLDHTVDDFLELAKGKSILADVPREGIVIRPLVETYEPKIEGGRLSWKAINAESGSE